MFRRPISTSTRPRPRAGSSASSTSVLRTCLPRRETRSDRRGSLLIRSCQQLFRLSRLLVADAAAEGQRLPPDLHGRTDSILGEQRQPEHVTGFAGAPLVLALRCGGPP